MISVNTTTGTAGFTTFIFNSNIQDTSLYSVVWYFGDGSSSNKIQPQHIYHSPGNYNVKLLVTNKNTSVTTSFSQILKITLELNASIKFAFIPPPTFAGHYNRYPFRIEITSPDTAEHYIDLGCQYSKSDQVLEAPNKWAFLRPQWKFLDLNGNLIQKIKTTDTPILDSTGTLNIGVSGYAEFYFTDDIYNSDLAANGKPYTTIIATLNTLGSKDYSFQTDSNQHLPSYSNSLATVACPHISLWRTPDVLKISENGIHPHYNPRWSKSYTPIVVTSGFSTPLIENFSDGNGVKIANPDSFFVHNFPLSNLDPIPVDIKLSGVFIECFPTPQMEWSDDSYYKTPGYYKGILKVPDEDIVNSTINASLSFVAPPLSSNYVTSLLWISNPENGSVLTANYFSFSEMKTVLHNPVNAFVYNISIPSVNLDIPGSHGIYSIVACPMPSYQAWMLDTDSEFLYRISTVGQILCAVDINKLTVDNFLRASSDKKVTPVGMSMDSQQNLWITLRDTLSTIKLDKYGNFILATTPFVSGAYGSFLNSLNLPQPSQLNPRQEVLSWYDQSAYYPSSADFNNQNLEYLIQPTYIDTDPGDNVYVSYTNPFSSFWVKYDSLGGISYIQSPDAGKTQQDLICDKDGNLWTTSVDNQYPYNWYIKKLTPEGNIFNFLTPNSAVFGPFNNVNYIALDNDQNLWFTHDYRNVTKITQLSGTLAVSFVLSSVEVKDSTSFINGDDYALEGICADTSGRIYVINSVENKIYVLNKNSVTVSDSFWINPQGYVIYPDSQDNIQETYDMYNKSALAQGDWSGFRWINKYASKVLPEYANPGLIVELSGSSRVLDFYKDNSHNNFFKNNENYDLSQTLKNYAFTPTLLESDYLFDSFFGSIFGKYPFNPDDLGVEMYEKISNFVPNHNDIDTCNIDELYNNAALVDLDTDDYRLNYPPAIKRLMNLASINLSRLRGSQNNDGLSFQTKNSYGFFNRGPRINSLNYEVSANVPLVLGTKNAFNPYRLIYTGPINGSYKYSLDTLSDYLGLTYPWSLDYEYFEYIPSTDGDYLDGIIDWNNPQTTISFSNSASDAWDGSEGILETNFVYELYKGLNLLNS